jgi:chromosome segregation ATPase
MTKHHEICIMYRHVKLRLLWSISARSSAMARHGVDFESVKQAALKLLSKGISPSTQKIRELLGTGSHTTIAEHLKIWREAHAAKKVHHLPATIPEELIATFETLWQTAMEHAEKHLAGVKIELENQEEKLCQEKMLADKTVADLKSQLNELNQNIDNKTRENQLLQTNLAVAAERFQNQTAQIDTLKQQHELRLKHLHDEKHKVIDEVNKLQAEITFQNQNLLEKTEKHQAALAKERALQEESEKRWAQIIDQARSETKISQKKYEEAAYKQMDQIKALQDNLVKLQDNLTIAQTTLIHKNEIIDTQSKQIEKGQGDYTSIVSELALLKAKIVDRKTNKKLLYA